MNLFKGTLTMKNLFYSVLLIALLLTACTTTEPRKSMAVFTDVFNPDSLPAQTFVIDAGRDTVLKGAQGTILRIEKNTFRNINNPVTGPVTIELKEVFNPADMVMGNLTTTADGKFLQTGGMLYVGAKADNQELYLTEGKSIGVETPTDSVMPGMAIYEGWPVVQLRHGDEPGDKNDTSTTLNWENPVPVEPVEMNEPVAVFSSGSSTKICTYEFTVDGVDNPKIPEVDKYFNDLCNYDIPLEINKDTIVKVGKYNVTIHKWNEVMETSDNTKSFKSTPTGNQNLFTEDYNTSYIFTLKRLGWANIDRLYENPKTQPVNLIVDVTNTKDFELVYTSMVIEKMYLPGYQKKDNTYGFTHGDDEQTQLPVGVPATIIATAYKEGKVFYALKKITVSPKQSVQLKLEENTKDGLKKTLQEKL